MRELVDSALWPLGMNSRKDNCDKNLLTLHPQHGEKHILRLKERTKRTSARFKVSELTEAKQWLEEVVVCVLVFVGRGERRRRERNSREFRE